MVVAAQIAGLGIHLSVVTAAALGVEAPAFLPRRQLPAGLRIHEVAPCKGIAQRRYFHQTLRTDQAFCCAVPYKSAGVGSTMQCCLKGQCNTPGASHAIRTYLVSCTVYVQSQSLVKV